MLPDPAREMRVRDGVRRRTLCADSIAVFDPYSWRTHVVSGAAALLLTLFAERGSQKISELADALGLAQAGFPDDEAEALVDKALSELHACDLIEFADAERSSG